VARTGLALIGVASVLAAVTLLTGCTADGDPARRPWKEAPPTVAAIPVPSAGNGVAEMSAPDILAKAIASTAAATSVRVTGSVAPAYQTSMRRTDDGSDYGSRDENDFAIDMLFTATGSTGNITEAGTTLRVLRVQRQVWLGGQDFWTRLTSERAAPSYQGKYVPLAVDDSALGPIVDASYLVPLLNKLLRVDRASLVKAQPTSVHGVPAIALVSSGRGFGGTVWVATHGQPHVLRVQTAKDSDMSGALDFTDYDQRVPLTPPAPSQVVDPTDLTGPLRRTLGSMPGFVRPSPSPNNLASPNTQNGPSGPGQRPSQSPGAPAKPEAPRVRPPGAGLSLATPRATASP
jgi:hypothetical protein